MSIRIDKTPLFAIAATVFLAASPAHASGQADPVAALDALSRATADASSGLALARRQVGEGDLLGALATVERVLLNDTRSDEARLLHASLLCRLDDPSGYLIEFEDIDEADFSARTWSEATAPCRMGEP
jgi:hypothetical protein